MNSYINVWKNFANFSGRTRRREYWEFVLVNIVVSIALVVLEMITPGLGIISTLYSWALFIPAVALLVRRLHDINKSANWISIVLVPFIGIVVLIIFALTEGTQGENQYGDDPKEEMITG